MSSHEEWISMYTLEMDGLCSGKSKHLRKLDMLLYAFNKEISDIKINVQTTYELAKTSIEMKYNETTKKTKLLNMGFSNPIITKIKKPIKSNSIQPKESPDIFSQRIINKEKENIDLSDAETIMSSPEKCNSPRIRKNRTLKLRKNKELSMNEPILIVNAGDNTQYHEIVDDFIESTPEARPAKQNIKVSTRKNLFSNSTSKVKQKSFKQSTIHQSLNLKMKMKNAPSELKNSGEDKILDFKPPNNTTVPCSQSSFFSVEEILKKVSNEKTPNKTEVIDIISKRKCRYCDMNGSSPCMDHRPKPELREPDQTFTGIWEMDFDVPDEAKKARPNHDNNDSNNSTILI